jgi:glutamate--cysteine ligase
MADGSRPDFSLLKRLAAEPLARGGRISLEPGSQVEVATRPHSDVATVLEALHADVGEMTLRLAANGIEVVGGAIDTTRAPERTCPDVRYVDLEREVDGYSAAGRWMMNNTCALQVNVGVGSPLDGAWRAMNTVAPLLTAAFANSVGVDQRGNQWKSLRQGCWVSMDPRRAAPPASTATSDPVDDYLDYAIAAPVLGDVPVESVADVRRHLSTLFPPVRPRRWLEVRCIDMVDGVALRAAVAAVVALASDRVIGRVLAQPAHGVTFTEAASLGLASPQCRAAVNDLFAVLVEYEAETPGPSDGSSSEFGGALAAFQERFLAHGHCPGDVRSAPTVLHSADATAANPPPLIDLER